MGSSPLTRGKLPFRVHESPHAGLIPAHAGKTIMRLNKEGINGAHPRSRGENIKLTAHARPSNGSSPLTRGKRPPPVSMLYARGLIPAHAGKTYFLFVLPRRAWAHPRSRGENSSARGCPGKRRGSSRLTRGKLWMVYPSVRVRGLIPAHAGKTQRTAPTRAHLWAHPRSRGENTTHGGARRSGTGSSPLTRGKLDVGDVQPPRSGLIPAHAGKTPSCAACPV